MSTKTIGRIYGFKIESINWDAQINKQGWQAAWEDLISGEAAEIWDYFEQSLSGFHRHSPSITQKGSATIGGNGNIEVVVGVLTPSPDNNIYSHVNWGTSPRIITAHNPRGMRFRVRYTPATARGTLLGGTWTKTGPWQVKFTVHHPGIQARRFDDFIQFVMRGSIRNASQETISGMRGKFWRKS